MGMFRRGGRGERSECDYYGSSIPWIGKWGSIKAWHSPTKKNHQIHQIYVHGMAIIYFFQYPK